MGNAPPKQRTLYLQHLAAPRMGNASQGRPDEPFAFESRDALRKVCLVASIISSHP